TGDCLGFPLSVPPPFPWIGEALDRSQASGLPHPRWLGPDRRATRGSWSLIRPPLTIVAIGSIPAIFILASDFLSAPLVAAPACFHRASGQARCPFRKSFTSPR